VTYLDRVLDLWSLNRDELDTTDLFWRRRADGSWEFFILCNDFFGPGSDAETIHEDDLDDLERAVADVKALGIHEESWAPFLWIAQKRRSAPWRLNDKHTDMPESLRELFRAAGA
jgi:hypothetical protein